MLPLHFLFYWIWNVGIFVLCTITSNDDFGNSDTNLLERKKLPQARIINGESISARKYPFLAQVYLKVFDGKENIWQSSGGSIVTKSIILTCGHCVCIAPNAKDEYRFETCLSDLNP